MGEVYAQFSGGSGSANDPYQISDIQQLQEVSNHLDKHFILVNDIEAAETSSWNDGKGFLPIGSNDKGFTGSLDGKDFRVNKLNINRPNSEYVGLFGLLNNAELQNIHLDSIFIKGGNTTGSLAGRASKSTISGSSVTGKITGRTYVGGIVGFNRGRVENTESKTSVIGRSYVGGVTGINRGRVIRAVAEAQVSGTGHNIGVLVGNNYDGLISESISSGSATGEEASSVGGLTGSNGGIITRSFSTAAASGRSYVGGLVGNNHSGEIQWSYSSGDVKGFNLVGGLAGVNRKDGIIEECYTTSKVEGTIDAGGFIGVNRDPVKAGFWNKDSSTQKKPLSKGTMEGISAVSAAQITGAESYQHLKGFSFNKIWGYVPDKTPQLLWTMPYFVITEVEGASSITSGDLIEFEVAVKNAGYYSDTNDIILNDGKGTELDQLFDISLDPGEDTTFSMIWQSTVNDKGEYDLSFESQFYKKIFPLKVFRIPEIVELEQPFGLEEHINTSPTFSWEEAFLADHYQLQISDNEDFSPVKFNITDIDTTTYTLKEPLEYLSYYHWRVRGTNADEMGPWSEPSEFITIIERPEVVELKTPEDEAEDASTKPFFSWYETKRAENYRLQLASDEEFEEVIFDSTFIATDSSLTFEKNLPSKQQLFWRMQATNIGGNSDWSEERSFKAVRSPVRKSAFSNNLEYKLEQNYPNPFNPITFIRYSIPEATHVEIEVLNMLGQTVATLEDDYKSAGWHTVTFDASKLSSGFYIYRIKTEDFSASRKLSLVK
ncbi:MAG: T9SS type A sorting domain-containing protein [Gracilimonas sp.]|uniref:T9SS type A sorting domain-containing protein n=1 Tax=Gracilimonas sp. TaxID=1974203 RepID=UPI0032EC66FB